MKPITWGQITSYVKDTMGLSETYFYLHVAATYVQASVKDPRMELEGISPLGAILP